MGYLDCLYGHEWELTKRLGWRAPMDTKRNGQHIKMVPDAHDKNKKTSTYDANY